MSEGSQNWCYDQLKVDISWHICPLWHFFLDFLIQMYALFTHGSLAQELLAAWGRRGQWGSCNRHFAWSFVAQQVDPNIINYPPCDIIFMYFHHLSVCLSLIDLSTVKALVKPIFFSSKNEALKGLGVGWSSRQPPNFSHGFQCRCLDAQEPLLPKPRKGVRSKIHDILEGKARFYLFISLFKNGIAYHSSCRKGGWKMDFFFKRKVRRCMKVLCC